VTNELFKAPTRLSPLARAVLLLSGLILATALGVARGLEPSSRGYGTHRQMGLPPCTFVALFDMRCPSCGMTTAWANMVRGNLMAALSANTGGALLAVLAVVASPWMIISAVRGRTVGRIPRDSVLAAGAGFVALITLADWAVRLYSR
jgi:hypothetical protein